MSQCFHWLNLCGTASRNPRREKGNAQQQSHAANKRDRIVRRHSIQHRLDQAREPQRRAHASNNPCCSEPCAFAQNHTANLSRLRTQRQSNTDLVGTLRNRVRHDPVDPDASKRQRQHAKAGGQCGKSALHLHRGVDLLPLGAEVDDGQVAIDGLNDTAQFREKSGRLHVRPDLVDQRAHVRLLHVGKEKLGGGSPRKSEYRVSAQIPTICIQSEVSLSALNRLPIGLMLGNLLRARDWLMIPTFGEVDVSCGPNPRPANIGMPSVGKKSMPTVFSYFSVFHFGVDGLTFRKEVRIAHALRNVRNRSGSNVFHAWQRGKTLFELLVQLHIFRPRVAAGRRADFEEHEIIRFESHVHRIQFQKRAQKKARTHDEQRGESNLKCHDGFSGKPFPAA